MADDPKPPKEDPDPPAARAIRTRCKFSVQKTTKFSKHHEQITLSAVYGGSPENISFAAATPSGTLEITVTNPDVIGTFEPGAYYYVDLIPAEK